MRDRSNYGSLRAIRGPVIVITVGVLFAVGNFTPYTFDQTWPVLIIVVGLLALLGRGTAPPLPPAPPYTTFRPPAYPPPPPPAGPGGYRQTPYSQSSDPKNQGGHP